MTPQLRLKEIEITVNKFDHIFGELYSNIPSFGRPHFHDQIKWLIDRVRRLEEALHKLERESSGFVSMANPADHGNTNIAVMKHWIENARQALEGENE